MPSLECPDTPRISAMGPVRGAAIRPVVIVRTLSVMRVLMLHKCIDQQRGLPQTGKD